MDCQMNARRWVSTKILLVFLFLLIIGCFNYVVDPTGVYSSRSAHEPFTEKLFSSKYGLVVSGLSKRSVKFRLAQSDLSDFGCVVLGSSHVMQISSVRNTGGIESKCGRLLNLGVSGGSIEDVAIFSYGIIRNKNKPKSVLIGVDPWTLKFGMDYRYKIYEFHFKEMQNLLGFNLKSSSTPYFYDIAKNLINKEYFVASLRFLNEGKSGGVSYPHSSFTYENGYVEEVTLPDGSLVYSNDYIEDAKKNISKKGEYSYKLNRDAYHRSAVSFFMQVIELLRKNNIEVELIMTPYAPKVFLEGETKVVSYLKDVDRVVRDFSLRNNLKVYGSFFPSVMGCENYEFYDYMHAMNECLNRIDISR